jgi:very-short-patch-repair endonuclease
LWFELGELNDLLRAASEDVEDWDKVRATPSAEWSAIADALRQHAHRLIEARTTWLGQVLSDASEPLLSGRWRDFIDGAASERESVIVAATELAPHWVEIPEEFSHRELVEAIGAARGRFDAGRPLGLGQRSSKRLLGKCKVDGETPTTVNDLSLLTAELQRRASRESLRTRWTNLQTDYRLPELNPDQPIEIQAGEHLRQVAWALDWSATTWPDEVRRLTSMGLRCPDKPSVEQLSGMADVCDSLRSEARSREITLELQALADLLVVESKDPDASVLWLQLRRALNSRKPESWDAAMQRAAELRALVSDARRRDQLMIHLGRSAPLLAVAVEGGDDPLGGDGLADQWRIRQLTCWLDRIEQLPATGDLQRRLESLAVQRRVAVAELVTAMAWDHLASSVTDKRRRALNRFTEANRKIGRATGRYAPMWQAEARAAMDDAKDAVPVWIMPIHKVISSFRPNADPPFDVIIIDEASQVGLLESLVLGLAKQAIVVGDEKQTSPENVGLERQSVYDALDRHFPDMPDRRTRFSPDNSLYDLARQQFPDVVQLTEHFRSLPQLIEFSSRRWYDGSIVPLRDRPPTPGWQQLGSVFVPRGTRRGNDDANMQEAEAVVALIDELVRDSTYDGMSIGVITLMGTGQAPLISGMLLDRLGPQVVEERAIRVGDAAGFQGDERDVIVYSLVVAHDPDRRIGAMTDDAANRRINVAASRARNQSWMVHSVQPEDLHRNDPRRWLLEYHLAPPDEAELQSNLDVADSDFERDVIREIVAAGYRRVRAQYLVGGYRIDIVVEGPDGRLAVECDGDFWHGPERWQADRERQQVLERAGWTFERIRGSSFYRNRKAALAPLWGRLRELGIPTGDWEERDFATMRREWPVDFEVGELAVPATESPVRKEATDQALIAQPDGDRWEERATETLSVSPDGSQHPLPGLAPTVAEVRSWARGLGMPIGDRGRLPPSVVAAWNSTHPHQLIPAGEGEPPRRATRQSSHTADGLDGPRTQEYDFYIPILEALVQLGGEAPARQVLPMVEQRMMDEFTPADLQPIASSPDYPRWDKTANWARQELAELGYIVRPGRYGIWEISESGRAWLTGQLGQPSPPSSLAADAAPVGDSEHS